MIHQVLRNDITGLIFFNFVGIVFHMSGRVTVKITMVSFIKIFGSLAIFPRILFVL